MKPTSSKGRSPWKVKKVGGTVAGGIVIRNGAILVNQGLRKVKLEEDFVELKPELPVSMEIEQDSNSGAPCTGEVLGDGEAVTEEYGVTKVEVDIPNIQMSSEGVPAPSEEEGHHDHGSSSSWVTEEMEALKRTMKQLSSQMVKQNEAIKKQEKMILRQNEDIKKQNEVISGMKSFIRNIGLSVATYFNNGEDEGNGGGRHGSGGSDNVDGEGVTCNKNSSKEDDCHVTEGTSKLNHSGSSKIPETSSNEAGFTAERNSEDQIDSDLDDDDDADLQENDGDRSFVPDDSEGESNIKMEDNRHNRQGNQLE